MRKICSSFTVITLLLSLQACGGGGDATVVPRAQKTALVEFAASTTNTDPSGVIKGVTMVAKLPAGVTVTPDAPGGTTISNALTGVNNFLISFPTYVAANNEVTFYATNVSNSTANVVYARLTCDVKPGNTLTAEQFSSIIPSVYEPVGPGGSDLTLVNPPVISKISATFGY